MLVKLTVSMIVALNYSEMDATEYRLPPEHAIPATKEHPSMA
jgi:hypothetical protein